MRQFNIVWMVIVAFLSGCTTVESSKDNTVLYLSTLNNLYKGEDLDYKGESVQYGRLLAEPVSCNGWAGEGVAGFGAHLFVAPVELEDGSVVIALLADEFDKGYRFWGHLIFVASDAFPKLEQYIPKIDPEKEKPPLP